MINHPDGMQEPNTFQEFVEEWMLHTFGLEIAMDKTERGHRFLEEALELVQAGGMTQEDAHQLVDYTFGRPVGELKQEVGGTMVTLAALCSAHGVSMGDCAKNELARNWINAEKIRAKQKTKPKFGPLPGNSDVNT